jgi:hypothetical protein
MIYLIAERSLEPARAELSSDVSNMSAAELRGYVRARAHHTVRVQAEHATLSCGLPQSALDELVTAALERTVQLIARQPLRAPVMQLPAPHVRLRIAG